MSSDWRPTPAMVDTAARIIARRVDFDQLDGFEQTYYRGIAQDVLAELGPRIARQTLAQADSEAAVVVRLTDAISVEALAVAEQLAQLGHLARQSHAG